VFPAEKVMCIGDIMAWDMGLLVDPSSGGSMIATPVTLGKAADAITGVDRVIEGHGDANTWAGFLRYLGYTRKVVEVARKGNEERPQLRRGVREVLSPPIRRWRRTSASSSSRASSTAARRSRARSTTSSSR
jgi:hypothetical protein